jgi:crotonobetainyl-CoA:carnitine CoA-transferase CaiB-like acyl-CoA transferase
MHLADQGANVIKVEPPGGDINRRSRQKVSDVPCAPVLRRNEIIENVQVLAMNLIRKLDQPSVGEVRQPQPAALFADTPSNTRGPAPGIGEIHGTSCTN